jgi:hypothetical protein
MATRKNIKKVKKVKSRRRKGNRKTKQRGGCAGGVCMAGGSAHKMVRPTV